MPVEEQYKSKEALLEYARIRANDRSTEPSQDVRRDIQTPTGSDTRDERERIRETSGSNGGNGSFQGSTRSDSRFIDQFADINKSATGSYSSTYQSDTRARGRGNSWGDRVKDVFKPIQEALKPSSQKKRVPGKKEQYKRLSDTEVLKMSKPLVESLLWFSEHLDEFIRATTKGHQEVEIWGDLDRAECEIIADFMIARGKIDARTAQVVRELISLQDKIKLGLITIPRVYRTFKIYLERGISIR